MYNTNDIEQSVLGCLIDYPALYAEKISLLTEDCFTSDSRKNIFKAIVECYSQYGPSYDNALISGHIINLSNNKPELTLCCLSGNATAPIDEHIKVLLDKAKTRFVEQNTQGRLSIGQISTQVLREIADKADNLYSYSSHAKNRDVYDRYIEQIQKPIDLLYTRYSKIDKIMGGLQRGTLTVIGARPSVGKTTFSLNIAQNIASYGKKVIFFSLEMTSEQIINRLVSRGCNLDYSTLQKAVTSEQRQSIIDYLGDPKIKDHLSIIDDTNCVESICSTIMLENPDVAVIDYAQIIRTLKSNDENPRTRIDYISAELKAAAKRKGTRVLLLSQLRRPEAGKKYKSPSMADLKESSGLEQDADYVVLISRPFAETAKTSDNNYLPQYATVTVDKNRYGRLGRVDMNFDGSHQSFTEKNNALS